MSEYPEHIDQIDDFYRSQLADHEIEPPEGLWNKISLGALEATPGSEAKASTGLTVAQKYLGILAVAILLITGAYYYYGSKQELPVQDDATTPTTEQPSDPNVNSSGTEVAPLNQNSSSNSLKNKKSQSSTDANKKDAVTTPDLIENQSLPVEVEKQPEITTPVEEQKADSVAEIKTTQKAPKEKVKFKDKYKKDYQDSTRKIFVPGK